jgi:hypothetical protein
LALLGEDHEFDQPPVGLRFNLSVVSSGYEMNQSLGCEHQQWSSAVETDSGSTWLAWAQQRVDSSAVEDLQLTCVIGMDGVYTI